MHHLGQFLQAIMLSNNNMRDEEIAFILRGMLYNPIGRHLALTPIAILKIDNNKLGFESIKTL